MGCVDPCHGIAVGFHRHRYSAQVIAGQAVDADLTAGSGTGSRFDLRQALDVIKQVVVFALGAQTQLAVIDEAALRLLILEGRIAEVDLGDDLLLSDVIDPQGILFPGIAAAEAEGIVDPALIHGAALGDVHIVLHLELIHDALRSQDDLLGRAGIGSLGGRCGEIKLGDDVGAVLGIAFDVTRLDHAVLHSALGAVAGAMQIELACGVRSGIAVHKGSGPAPAGTLIAVCVGPFTLGAVSKSAARILGEFIAVVIEDDDLDALRLPLTVFLINALHSAAAVEAVGCPVTVVADGNIQQGQRVAFFKLGCTEHSLIGMVGIVAAGIIGTQVKLCDPLLGGHVKQIGHTGVETLHRIVAVDGSTLYRLSGFVGEAHQQAFLIGLGAYHRQHIAQLHIAGHLGEGGGIVLAVIQTQNTICIRGDGLGTCVSTADIHIAVVQGQCIPVIEGAVFGKPQDAVLNGQRSGLAFSRCDTIVHIDGGQLAASEGHIHIAGNDTTGVRTALNSAVVKTTKIRIVSFQLDTGHPRRAIAVKIQRRHPGTVDGHMGSTHTLVGAAALHEVDQLYAFVEDDGGIRHLGIVIAALNIADGTGDHLQTGAGNRACFFAVIGAHTDGDIAIYGVGYHLACSIEEHNTLAEFHRRAGIKLRTGAAVALPDGNVLKLHRRYCLKDTLLIDADLQGGAIILAVAGAGNGDLTSIGRSRKGISVAVGGNALGGHIPHQHDGAAVGQQPHSST